LGGKTWSQMPRLLGGSGVGSLKTGATALARSRNGHLLLAVQRYGRGRSAALTVDTTWRWWLKGTEEPAGAYHKRFWRRLVLWLARRDIAQNVGVWIYTDELRYDLSALSSRHGAGRRVEVRAGVFDDQGRPIQGAQVEATLNVTGGPRRPIALRPDGAGGYVGSLGAGEIRVPGDYTVTLRASRDGRGLGSAKSRFAVDSSDAEMADPLANRVLLKEIAQSSGGKVVSASGLREFFEELVRRPLKRYERVRHTWRLWDTPLLLVLLIGILSAEWVLRRRHRLA
ncbi:MAG: hypothetical protein QGD94_06435, partial [Planctomycetia bacterium]|nr:hypothetical protein [Planctomycetia bacterium]